MGMKVNAELPLPADLKAEYPMPEKSKEIKKERDQEIRDIFTGKSDKFIVLVGPCSADNEDSVCEYVNRLAKVNEKVSDRLMIIPRIYTNKPRTTGEGYKGMLHQPEPDKAPDLLAGSQIRRESAAQTDSQWYGYTDWYEESNQWRFCCYVEFGCRSTTFAPVYLSRYGCDNGGK